MGWIIKGSGLHHDASVLSKYAPDVSDRVHLARNGTGRPTWSWASSCSPLASPARALGDLLQDDRRPSRHVAGEPATHMGVPPLQDQGRFDEQLVGRCLTFGEAGTTTTTPIQPAPVTAWRGST